MKEAQQKQLTATMARMLAATYKACEHMPNHADEQSANHHNIAQHAGGTYTAITTAITTTIPHHNRRRRLHTGAHSAWRQSSASVVRPTYDRTQGQDRLPGHPANSHGVVAVVQLPPLQGRACGHFRHGVHSCGRSTWWHAWQAAQVPHNLGLRFEQAWKNSDVACLWVHTSIGW